MAFPCHKRVDISLSMTPVMKRCKCRDLRIRQPPGSDSSCLSCGHEIDCHWNAGWPKKATGSGR